MTIGCPSCRRRLRLPGYLSGQQVQCPMCGQAFTASAELIARPERSIQEPPALPPRPLPEPDDLGTETPHGLERTAAPGEAPCPYCGAFIDRESIRCAHCGRRVVGTGGGPFWVRRDCEPHRGPLIQALGVASILLSVLTFPLALVTWGIFRMPVGAGLGLLALGLGVAAWLLSTRDLARMEQGLMDPQGRPRTLAGRQCGILGVVFSLLCGGGCGLLAVAPLLSRL